MKLPGKSLIMSLLICALAGCADFSARIAWADEEQVTFYPTYGYRDGDHWVIPLRLWVHERRTLVEKLAARIAASAGGLTPAQLNHFRTRIQAFVVDSESHEAVTFQFDNDPENQQYGYPAELPKTNLNGLAEGAIRLPLAKAEDLLLRQGADDGWLAFHATSPKLTGTGRVQLIDPVGVSVISDIDDTIKVTQINAGTRVVIDNTFFSDFVAVPAMAELYQSLHGAAFHYVSGAPWQLYGPLAEFVRQAGFPEGTFHMKRVTKNLFSADTWRDLKDLVINENFTFGLKVLQISTIMQRFPQRKFILIGDSGEKDPEVYREIRDKFPAQVQEIIIRDVVNDKQNKTERLQGMTIIDAVAPVH
jgi:hypothetical protein